MSVESTSVEPVVDHSPVPHIMMSRGLPDNHNRSRSSVQFEVTAYCLHGETTSGTHVTPDRTIAADWSVLPKGTQVRIEGFDSTFVVEDTGSDIKGNRIDIYMSRYKDCITFGRRKLFVQIVK